MSHLPAFDSTTLSPTFRAHIAACLVGLKGMSVDEISWQAVSEIIWPDTPLPLGFEPSPNQDLPFYKVKL